MSLQMSAEELHKSSAQLVAESEKQLANIEPLFAKALLFRENEKLQECGHAISDMYVIFCKEKLASGFELKAKSKKSDNEFMKAIEQALIPNASIEAKNYCLGMLDFWLSDAADIIALIKDVPWLDKERFPLTN
jgi:hypothetical protein